MFRDRERSASAIEGLTAPTAAATFRSQGRHRVALRLGERLIEKGWITHAQLEEVLKLQRASGGLLGDILLEMGAVTSAQLGEALEEVYGVPYVQLSNTTIDSAAVQLVPESVAREKKVLPLRVEEDRLVTAMVDPLDLSAIDALRHLTGKRIVPVVVSERELQRTLYEYFNPVSKALHAVEAESAASAPEVAVEQDVEDAPTVRLVNSILHGAIVAGASDIHLEPQEAGLRVRFRIDGLLREHMLVPRAQQAAFLARIKVMTNMNIAETRRCQDGRATVRESGRAFDLRVSSIPVLCGEKMVLRLLDKETIAIPLEKLGMLPDQLRDYEALIQRPYGMILVTGPTGAGKSTTLYATLNRLNEPHRNITTIEDPVEYQLPGINQTQVNPRADVTFASGLRALVRQDPDIILVGEIRDRETAEVAIQAALTGHLVFSTLHTNSAAGALTRLVNMGVEPFLVSSAVTGVVAQRLLRRVCPRCEEGYRPEPELLRELRLEPGGAEPFFFKRGRGCRSCNGTGYQGRTAVYEILRMTEKLRATVLRRASTEELERMAVREGMRPLVCSVAEKILQGITTPEEAARILQPEEFCSCDPV